jgi:hypothetical protein
MAGYIGTKASVVSSGSERKRVFAITGTTTSLTGLAYTPSQVHVFHNGVRLVDGTDYTATNGSTITLTTAAENGDEIVVLSSSSFQVADAVPATGGTFSGNVTFAGSATFTGGTVGAGGGYYKGENGTVGSSAGDMFRINEQTLNTDVTIDATENANVTGPITVATGVTLTVSTGGTLAVV